jgi:hypothetical protein
VFVKSFFFRKVSPCGARPKRQGLARKTLTVVSGLNRFVAFQKLFSTVLLGTGMIIETYRFGKIKLLE